MLRRQTCRKTLLFKIPRELCFDANSACTARARVSARQAVDTIVGLLRAVPIVGINELHPAHQKTYDDGDAAEAARRTVLRQLCRERALLATASARDRDRRGRAGRGGHA